MARLNRRRFLATASGLFVPAWFGITRAQDMISPGPIMRTMASGGQTFLIDEGFEGTGVPSGWTDNSTGGVRDFDYTSTVLDGSQSLFFEDPGSSGEVRIDCPVTASDELYVTFRAQWVNAVPNNNTNFVYAYNGATLLAFIRTHTTKLTTQAIGGTSVNQTALVPPTASYMRIKWRIKKGSGANFESEIWVADDNDPAWSVSAKSGDGTGTAQIDKLRFMHAAQSTTPAHGVIVDKFRVSTTDIAIGNA